MPLTLNHVIKHQLKRKKSPKPAPKKCGRKSKTEREYWLKEETEIESYRSLSEKKHNWMSH